MLKNFFCRKLDEIENLFDAKHKQYGTDDPLANFRNGAAMLKGTAPSSNDMYKELLGYMRKHIAFVMTHDIGDSKVDESLQDIAVYCIIALYMRETATAEQSEPEELSNIYLEKVKYENLCRDLERQLVLKDGIIQKQVVMLSKKKTLRCPFRFGEEAFCAECKYREECEDNYE